jgi:Uma2 family endonuclease
MATVEAKLMTAEEFYEFVNRPENRDRVFDLVRGEVVEMTKPGKFHGFVCGNIAAILWMFARDRKKGYVCTNDTGTLVERDPDTVRGPDILFFEDAESPSEIDRKFGETPPLLAIEVLSPNDTHGKLMRRVREQLDFGTPLVWVVDPEAENVTVYRRGKEVQVVESDGEITGDDAIPDLRCRVSEFFALPGK